jgi:hypothetical protein
MLSLLPTTTSLNTYTYERVISLTQRESKAYS